MYKAYMQILRRDLPLGESFDVLERKFRIGGHRASVFFVDGLTDGRKTQFLLNYLLSIKAEEMEEIKDSRRFLEIKLPFLDSQLIEPQQGTPRQREKTAAWDKEMVRDCCLQGEQKLYAGLSLLLIEGFERIILMDTREYPSRSVEEPEKEKSLRGAKDGFTESLMENVGLVRRRIRDNDLIIKCCTVGSVSKTDVAVCYMKGKADEKLVARLEREIKKIDAECLTVGEQSLLEKLLRSMKAYGKLNPFPRVRYSQRPDVIAAHVTEGKIAVIVDNSPTVMLLPVGVFDFLQDVDDYYFPQATGNYFRLLRIVNFMVILFLTPAYMLIIDYEDMAPQTLQFFIPKGDFAVPILWQFILLELAIDGLKLASLNTPESLGTSLSVIGALILGEFSVESGWFIPQTILCMAVVSLASFTQPSIELSYGIKFSRILMVLGAGLLGAGGFIAGIIVSVTMLATTKTLAGTSYLYPLCPFDKALMKRLLFRSEK